MLNKIILIGRLTKDPELRVTNSGKSVCNFSLAVDTGYGENKRTDFIDVVVWGKIGETSAAYLSKGKMACVEGRLQIRKYDDRDGNKRSATEVVADSVVFLSPKDAGNSSAPSDHGYYATGDEPW